MHSSFVLRICPAAVGFFTLLCTVFFMVYRKTRFSQNNEMVASPLSSLSPPSSLSPNWTHHVFPSFHGEDVRKDFLSHIKKEFLRKGITPFIDNEIKRGESIGPELVRAIRASKIAIVLLSRNYASSSWCLEELVEIMKCRKELGQNVMAIFYKVDPSDVKKLAGDFGKVFRKTCVGKSKEDIERWRQALVIVATIAGFHSSNWDNEADMIERIATDVSNLLNNSTPSNDFNDFVGMSAHMKKIKPLLCLDSDEVRMIGIFGPSGIGKTTIARFLVNQLSNRFQLSTIVENIKRRHPRTYLDEYSVKLHLQNDLLSQLINQKDINIPHLGVAHDRLKDKRVLVVLDDVDRLAQLDAMAKETWWFGSGSRVIITTQDQKLLKAHGIKYIYKVNIPPTDEALQMFCMYAFGQKFPYDGFDELAWKVTKLVGRLPLGLRVMGSHFRGMSKHEWTKELPRLMTSLDTEIQSILKFSYDALDDEDKNLFLHIACFFNGEEIEIIEGCLEKKFLLVRQRVHVLAEKSLIYINSGIVWVHNLLVQLGREIVRKQSIHDPGKRHFLVDAREIYEVLTDVTGSRSVISIDLHLSEIEDESKISERAFEGMTNLQFLRFHVDVHNDFQKYEKFFDYSANRLHLPQGLNYLSRKLRVLHWEHFQMKCLPFEFHTEFLVKLYMPYNKLEKLWEGIQLLRNLKWMDLFYSVNLKELPDLSTATNLKELNLSGCSNLVQLPYSIGNSTNLKKLDLSRCSSLMELPLSIGKATNLENLDLNECSNLIELPSSIGNLLKLCKLSLKGCSKLEAFPTNINLESFKKLCLTNCLRLKSVSEISTNLVFLNISGTAIEGEPSSIKSWSSLCSLDMSYSKNVKSSLTLDSITMLNLSNTEIQEVPPWVKGISRLRGLVLKGCRKLVSLPQLPDSLLFLDAENCESLERLDCSFHNPHIDLNFAYCFKLNKEARDLIINTSTHGVTILPGREVPMYFIHRATGGSSLTIKLNEKHLHSLMRFKACILLVNKSVDEAGDGNMWSSSSITSKQNGVVVVRRSSSHFQSPPLIEHLYTFEVEVEVTSSELVFEFEVDFVEREIGECGVLQICAHVT